MKDSSSHNILEKNFVIWIPNLNSAAVDGHDEAVGAARPFGKFGQVKVVTCEVPLFQFVYRFAIRAIDDHLTIAQADDIGGAVSTERHLDCIKSGGEQTTTRFNFSPSFFSIRNSTYFRLSMLGPFPKMLGLFLEV